MYTFIYIYDIVVLILQTPPFNISMLLVISFTFFLFLPLQHY